MVRIIICILTLIINIIFYVYNNITYYININIIYYILLRNKYFLSLLPWLHAFIVLVFLVWNMMDIAIILTNILDFNDLIWSDFNLLTSNSSGGGPSSNNGLSSGGSEPSGGGGPQPEGNNALQANEARSTDDSEDNPP